MKTKKQLSPIMEAFIVLLVLFSGLLLWFANEFGLDSGPLYSEPLPEEIDRLEIYTYSDDTRESGIRVTFDSFYNFIYKENNTCFYLL